MGWTLIQEIFKGRGMLVYMEETSTVAMMISGGWGRRLRSDLVRKMVGILDMEEQRFDKGLDVGIYV